MGKRAAIVVLLLSLPPAPAPGADEESIPASAPAVAPSDPEARPSYWLRNREGWFWYRDPAPAQMARPLPAPQRRPQELVQFEAMQKRLDDLKRIAVMNPTDTNLLAYMRYQKHVMNKSELFSERWQRLVWTVPELDYSLTGRPTNAMAI